MRVMGPVGIYDERRAFDDIERYANEIREAG